MDPEVKEAANIELKVDSDTSIANEVALISESVLNERYEIQEKIGSGGMSTVYLGRHKALNKSVAIKKMKSNWSDNELDGKRFEQEAQSLSVLNHSNIVVVHDYGLAPDRSPFMVMEYLRGRTLADVIECGDRPSDDKCIDIFMQLCDALEHAHNRGIYHRDIKPSNIMLVPQDSGKDQVKLLDFGIATVMQQNKLNRQQLTQTGHLVGSPPYMSPEQCTGHKVDGRSDIYSLGCVMYELVTGSPAVTGDNALETIFKHINEGPKRIETLSVNPHLSEVIMRALERDPARRFQSASELRDALGQIKDGLKPKLPNLPKAASGASSGLPMKSSWHFPVAFLICAVIFAVGAIGWQQFGANLIMANKQSAFVLPPFSKESAKIRQDMEADDMVQMLSRSNVDYRNVDLHGISMKNCWFLDCRFESCDFSNAVLRSTETPVGFERCDFHGANFANARIYTGIDYSRFEEANLAGAKIDGQSLHDDDFSDAILNDASINVEMDAMNAVFRRAQMKRAQLTGEFPFSDFSGADLSDAKLRGGSFFNAKFKNANLTNADFSNADLSGADFTGANVTGAKFDGARGPAIGLPDDLLSDSFNPKVVRPTSKPPAKK
jgi:serine/threonine protein kinase